MKLTEGFFAELLKGVGRQDQRVKETKQVQNETADKKEKNIKIKTVVIKRRCKHSRQQKVTIEKEM